jgi:hypothetical protein
MCICFVGNKEGWTYFTLEIHCEGVFVATDSCLWQAFTTAAMLKHTGGQPCSVNSVVILDDGITSVAAMQVRDTHASSNAFFFGYSRTSRVAMRRLFPGRISQHAWILIFLYLQTGAIFFFGAKGIEITGLLPLSSISHSQQGPLFVLHMQLHSSVCSSEQM